MIHYGGPSQQGADATFMGYTESNTWTLPVESVPAHTSGDVLSFYVQAFAEAGTGDNAVDQAEELNTGEHLGSEWSKPATIEFE